MESNRITQGLSVLQPVPPSTEVPGVRRPLIFSEEAPSSHSPDGRSEIDPSERAENSSSPEGPFEMEEDINASYSAYDVPPIPLTLADIEGINALSRLSSPPRPSPPSNPRIFRVTEAVLGRSIRRVSTLGLTHYLFSVFIRPAKKEQLVAIYRRLVEIESSDFLEALETLVNLQNEPSDDSFFRMGAWAAACKEACTQLQTGMTAFLQQGWVDATEAQEILTTLSIITELCNIHLAEPECQFDVRSQSQHYLPRLLDVLRQSILPALIKPLDCTYPKLVQACRDQLTKPISDGLRQKPDVKNVIQVFGELKSLLGAIWVSAEFIEACSNSLKESMGLEGAKRLNTFWQAFCDTLEGSVDIYLQGFLQAPHSETVAEWEAQAQKGFSDLTPVAIQKLSSDLQGVVISCLHRELFTKIKNITRLLGGSLRTEGERTYSRVEAPVSPAEE